MIQRNQTTSAIDTRPLPTLPEARPAGQTVTSDVLVPALQNLLGGVGAGLVVERVLSVWFIIPRDAVNFWAYSVTLLVFGLATAIRAFRDEIVIMLHAWAERRNRQDYTELLQQNADLTLTISTLQAEVNRLASMDGGSGNGAVILIAYKLLSDYYLNQLPFTQIAVAERKACSRTVWAIINDFFRKAKIVNNNGGVLVDNLPDAFAAFMQAHNACTSFRTVGGKLIKAVPPTKQAG